MNLEELQNRLNDLSAWRKKEIVDAETLRRKGENKTYLRRALIVMLHAHCDSFLKEASACYLEYISYQDPLRHNHKTDITWLAINKKDLTANAIGLFNEKKPSELIKNILFVKDPQGKITETPKSADDAFNKISFSQDFLNFMCTFVLQFSAPTIFPAAADFTKLRNRIAHGEKIGVGEEDGELTDGKCDDLVERTVKFLDSLSSQILDHCTKKMAA